MLPYDHPRRFALVLRTTWLAFVLAGTDQACSAEMFIIAPPGDAEFELQDMSSDGHWIVGDVRGSGIRQSAIWSVDEGLRLLPFLTPDDTISLIAAVSDSGLAVGSQARLHGRTEVFWEPSEMTGEYVVSPAPESFWSSNRYTFISSRGDVIVGVTEEEFFGGGNPAVWRGPDYAIERPAGWNGVQQYDPRGISDDGRVALDLQGNRWLLDESPFLLDPIQFEPDLASRVDGFVDISPSGNRLLVSTNEPNYLLLEGNSPIDAIPWRIDNEQELHFFISDMSEDSALGGVIPTEPTHPNETDAYLWRSGVGFSRLGDLVSLPEGFTFNWVDMQISHDGRILAGRGVLDGNDVGWVIKVPEPALQAGDADMDCDFDEPDLVQVQVAAKYLTGEPATWGEGDWDEAPGGSVEDRMPPLGDGLFNQLDIVAALRTGTYLQGSYCADAGLNAMGLPVVPEPSAAVLLGFGLITLTLIRNRR